MQLCNSEPLPAAANLPEVGEPERIHSASAAKIRRRGCGCGRCAICRDNERWERIFQEKFVDPDYYNPPLRRDSTMNW